MEAFAVVVLTLAGCDDPRKEPQLEATPVKVSTKLISPVGRQEVLSYSGTIEADNTVSLGFSVSGRVSEVRVQEGQHVNAGELLATIETTEYQNGLLLAQAGLEQAADNFNRLDQLHSKGSLPERDYIAAKVALTQAQANKSTAEKRLNDTRLYAPFGGIVSAKLIEKGAIAGPGAPVFTILKTDKVYAQAAITESEIAKLRPGGSVTVCIPTLNDTLRGTVDIINPQADATSKTFNVKIRLTNRDGKLLPGMLSKIDIVTGRTVSAITVPAEAVVRDADDIPYVFVVNNASRVTRKRVATGGLLANELVITNGLQTGDNVVVQGQNKLKDGIAVQ